MATADRDDFARAYEAHVWHVYGFFAYRVPRRQEAEDLTQVTFERALRAWSRYDPEKASVGTWLLAIARNLLVDHYRSDRSRQQESIDQERLEEYGPSEELGADLGVDPDLAAAHEVLSDRERELLALRFGADLSGRELAEVSGLSLANVQQILSRALRMLRAELERL
jgi:RNA polymerase sigma-70 factor (ECF subfamily)